MIRRIVPVAAVAALLSLLVATAAFGGVKPKIGVYGSPAKSVCLAGTYDVKKCKGKIDLFKQTGSSKVNAYIGSLKTGCTGLDQFVSAGSLTIKNGKTGKSQSGNYYVDGKSIKLKIDVHAVWSDAKNVTITYKVTRKDNVKISCKSSAFNQKSIDVKWFKATDTGG
jgi:hypothetical protein